MVVVTDKLRPADKHDVYGVEQDRTRRRLT
jgi:hypothetical protein